MSIRLIRYTERPELWDDTGANSQEVWPEYNLHGDVLNSYWPRLFDEFPEFQFALYDEREREVLAEGHTITPIERYVSWGRADGEPFDPWIRVHTRHGGTIVKPVPHSMKISGSVADWQQWTGMAFPR